MNISLSSGYTYKPTKIAAPSIHFKGSVKNWPYYNIKSIEDIKLITRNVKGGTIEDALRASELVHTDSGRNS